MRDWWQRHFLTLGEWLCILGAVAVIVWSEHFGGVDELGSYLSEHAVGLYSVTAGVYGGLLGFIIATTAIILDKIDDLRLVRESRHYPQLWDTLLASKRALGLACLVSIVGLLETHPGLGERVVFFVWVGLSLLSIVRIGRCIWIFGVVVRLAAGPSAANRPPGG